MDLMTIFTGLTLVCMAATAVIGYVVNGINKKADEIKADTSVSLGTLQTQITEKAHKDEIIRIEARMDREFDSVRAEQRSGFADLKQDIKDMRQELMAALRDAMK